MEARFPTYQNGVMIELTSGAKVIGQPHLIQVYDMAEAMFAEFLESCTPPIVPG
jgi:hypothetical protein